MIITSKHSVACCCRTTRPSSASKTVLISAEWNIDFKLLIFSTKNDFFFSPNKKHEKTTNKFTFNKHAKLKQTNKTPSPRSFFYKISEKKCWKQSSRRKASKQTEKRFKEFRLPEIYALPRIEHCTMTPVACNSTAFFWVENAVFGVKTISRITAVNDTLIRIVRALVLAQRHFVKDELRS